MFDDWNPWWRQYPLGWKHIVDDLVEKLDAINPDWIPVQAYSRLGSLCIYADGINAEQENLIRKAELMSYRFCQSCSSEEQVSTDALGESEWIATLCAKCRDSLSSKK
jgi:hypothetical protein